MRIEYTHDFIAAFNKAYDGMHIRNDEQLKELQKIAESWMMPPEQKKPYLDLIENALAAMDFHGYDGD
jgi:hypothetical protein